MRTEEEIKERLERLSEIKNEVGDILTHGYPQFITTYESALYWVLGKYTLDQEKKAGGGA